MKIIKKQANSKKCIICGLENEYGLKAPFYEMEDSSVVSIFEYRELHQSYPERVHGGLISAMLDELIGRTIWIFEPETWGVTMDLHVKFRRPVPYNAKLKAVGKITRTNSRLFEGVGELFDMDGNLLASAEAIYFKMPLNKISNMSNHDDINIFVPDDLQEI